MIEITGESGADNPKITKITEITEKSNRLTANNRININKYQTQQMLHA